MTGTGRVDLGVDLGGTKMLLLARDADRALIAEARLPTGSASTPADLTDAIRSFAADLPAPVRTVAIAVPGLVGPDGTVVVSDVLPGITGWRPRLAATETTFVLNDVRASLAYATDAAGTTDVLCVVAGTGVAAAFTNSATTQPFHGGAGWAGELGYLPVQQPGGRWATLDDVASGAALLRHLDLPPGEITRRVEDGDPLVTGHVRAAGAALGRGIACCVNLLNPSTLFVGGGACRFPGYLDAALDAAAQSSLPQSWAVVRVRTFPDGERFVAEGALLAAGCG